jgi:hypothetical protein
MLTTAWLTVDRVLHGANENTSDFVNSFISSV